MHRTYSLRNVAAIAAVSVVAGFSSARALQPIEEGLMRARASQECGEMVGNSKIILDILAQRAANEAAIPLRSELYAGFDSNLTLEFRYAVSQDGSLRLVGATASCGGAPCAGESELPRLIGALIAEEWGVRAPGRECQITLRASVPQLELWPCETPEEPVERGIRL